MLSLLIGVSAGVLTILLLAILRIRNMQVMYALILSGIGFLYVGFTWKDFNEFVITAIQAIVFIFIAYYGATKSIYVLAAGYFLHGLWDLGYTFFTASQLLPPDYDIFCLSIDFIMGAYIIVFKNKFVMTV